MANKKSEKGLNEKQKIKKERTGIIDKNKKKEKPKFGISINLHKNPSIKQQLAEKGIEINFGRILGSIFSKKNIRAGTKKVLKTADKMLKEDIKDYREFESKEKNGVKVEHGFRMRFLEDDRDDKNHSKWMKKKKKEKL